MGTITTKEQRVAIANGKLRLAVSKVVRDLKKNRCNVGEFEVAESNGCLFGTVETDDNHGHKDLAFEAQKSGLTSDGRGFKDGHYDWRSDIYIKPYIWVQITVA